MARPQKEWLDYFSMDVEKDIKIKLLKWKHGVLGFWVYVELLQYIYKQGYYTHRDEDNMLLFLSETGLKEEETGLMLEFMLDKDLFNRHLFDKYKILTSRGIQKRYSEWSKKRKEVEVESAFWIVTWYTHIKLMDTLIELKEEETELMATESTQSKVKESKVKESKGEEIIFTPTPTDFSSFVILSDQEKEALEKIYWASMTTEYITRIWTHIASKWDKFQSHYATILSWMRQDKVRPSSWTIQKTASDPPQKPLSSEQRKKVIESIQNVKNKMTA